MDFIDRDALRISVGRSRSLTGLAAGKGWLAVDKPSGLTVHNAPGGDVRSLVSAFIQKDRALCAQIDMDPLFGLHPVHRLDKETSGIVLLAADPVTFRFLSEQFESRQVKKRYLAILHGHLSDPPGDSRWGTWTWALAGAAGGRARPAGAGQGQSSETRYRVLARSTHYSMLEIELLTGRKHQIRRHAKLAGHPIAGDARYGSKRAADYLRRNLAFERLALHARTLTLLLPGASAPQTIRTPAIPEALQALFEGDREGETPIL